MKTNDIQITKADGTLTVESPYNPQFPAQAKALGGRWNPAAKAWTFDQRDEAAVHTMLTSIFGWQPETTGETVTIRVTLDSRSAGEKTVRFAGRQIAERRSRDAEVTLAPGVIIAEGKFTGSGGSTRYPEVVDFDGEPVTLEIRDLPREALEAEEYLDFEIVEEGSVDREALVAERARLVDRLAEIDQLLA